MRQMDEPPVSVRTLDLMHSPRTMHGIRYDSHKPRRSLGHPTMQRGLGWKPVTNASASRLPVLAISPVRRSRRWSDTRRAKDLF